MAGTEKAARYSGHRFAHGQKQVGEHNMLLQWLIPPSLAHNMSRQPG